MVITPEDAQAVYEKADLIYSHEQLVTALDRLAEEITPRIAKTNPLVISVLNGGLIPTGYLVTRFNFPLQLDYLHATRYRGKTTGGDLHWYARPQSSLKDRVVLLIDDILDEGHTLKTIVGECKDAGAKEVLSVAILEKMHGRDKATTADFIGLPVGNRYVFGFGMDYKGYLRNVPGIYAVSDGEQND